MLLTHILLNAYRCFGRYEIHFDDNLTLLCGANATGKTSILDAIAILLRELSLARTGGCTCFAIRSSDIKIFSKEASISYKILASKIVATMEKQILLSYRKNNDHEICESNWSENRRYLMRILDEFEVNNVFAYYSSKRILQNVLDYKIHSFTRNDAFTNAFEFQIDVPTTFSWFLENSTKEVFEIAKNRDIYHHRLETECVREAVSRILPEFNQLHVEGAPPQIYVTKNAQENMFYTLRQLSDGYLTMLALVMDLARRVVLAYPKTSEDVEISLEDIFHSPGIVLIDEIELHLHESWQDTILPSLLDVFPNIQFIVTTHSSRVCNSVAPKHIIAMG